MEHPRRVGIPRNLACLIEVSEVSYRYATLHKSRCRVVVAGPTEARHSGLVDCCALISTLALPTSTDLHCL